MRWVALISKVLILPAFLVLFACTHFSFAGKTSKQTKRSDRTTELQPMLSAIICTKKNSVNRTDLWSRSVFDAGIQFQYISKKDRKPPVPAEMLSLARKHAQNNSHLGYAYGACDRKSFWILSTPAPHAYMKELQLQTPQCAHTEWRFVRFDKGTSKNIDPHEVPDFVAKMNGTISYTCLLDQNENNGNQLWFLIKSNQYRPKNRDFDKLPLANWINHVRVQHNLPVVSKIPAHSLNKDQLAKLSKLTILHDRSTLQKLRRFAQSNLGLKFIGEDRVISKTEREEKWLLWNSPKHRDLILQPQAKHMIHLDRKNGDSSLSVILMFADSI